MGKYESIEVKIATAESATKAKSELSAMATAVCFFGKTSEEMILKYICSSSVYLGLEERNSLEAMGVSEHLGVSMALILASLTSTELVSI